MIVKAFLQARADRVIAFGRVIIAVFSFFGVWLEPTHGPLSWDFIYSVLYGYLILAVIIAAYPRLSDNARGAIPLIAHVVDLLFFSFLMISMEGPSSPFFLLFTYSMVIAAFRWQWKGALWTSLAVLAFMAILGITYLQITPTAPLEPDRLLIRGAHILVIGTLLVYFGFHQQRLADEAQELNSGFPDPLQFKTKEDFIRLFLSRAAEILRARRVLFVLQDPEEPWSDVYYWIEGQELQIDRLQVNGPGVLVHELLGDTTFLKDFTRIGVKQRGERQPIPEAEVAICPELQERYAIEQVLTAPVGGETPKGRIFLLDQVNVSPDDFAIIEVVASQLAVGLDRLQAFAEGHHAAAVEARLRMARDLHDGILQTLSGTALQLEALSRSAERDPDAFRERVAALQEWLVSEQRQLRKLIRNLRLGVALDSEEEPQPVRNLALLAQNLEKQWQLRVRFSVPASARALSPQIEYHLDQILREAVANAARHGDASKVTVGMRVKEDLVEMTISDNGSGLPQRGRFNHHECKEQRIGPRSLRERVLDIGGSMLISSSVRGLIIRIALPLPKREA